MIFKSPKREEEKVNGKTMSEQKKMNLAVNNKKRMKNQTRKL